MVDQAFRDDMNHFAFTLDDALDAHEARGQQHPALSVREIAPDDDVAVTGFIFQGDEGHARSGAGPLAAGDDARCSNTLSGWYLLEIGGGENFFRL